MDSELEGIGDDECIWFHGCEYPILDSSHLRRQKIDVDIIIGMNISQKKIFFQKPEIRISKKLIEDFSIVIRKSLEFVSVTLETKRPSKKISSLYHHHITSPPIFFNELISNALSLAWYVYWTKEHTSPIYLSWT